MKIALISDLHAEFKSQSVIPQLDRDVEVLVLAGDIDNCKKAVQRGLEIANDHAHHIVQVAGNHEFYGDRVDKGYNRLRTDTFCSSSITEIHFLQNDSVVINNVKFMGATLWTDYALYGRANLDILRASDYMNDHRRIKFKDGETYRKFYPKDALQEHMVSRQFIAREKGLPFKGKRVVVTHHAPSPMSIHAKYADPSELNSAYATDLEHYMGPGIDYWFHGHMHDPCDYTIRGTRVIANPHGYPGERVNPEILYMEI